MDPVSPRALWAILNAVRASTGYPDFLAQIIRAVRDNVPCDRATLYIQSRRRGTFLPAADHGTPASVVRAFATRGYRPGSFPGEEQLQEGKLLLAVRGESAPELEELLLQVGLHALALVPLVHGDQVVGTLSCGVERAPGFDALQIRLLEEIAPHLGLLIRSVRIENEQARLAARRTRLASLASEVLTASAPEVMASRLCAASRAIFRASRADLLMVEDDVLVAHGADSDGPVELAPRRHLDEAPILSESLRQRRVLVVNEFMTSRYAGSPRAQQLRPAAVLAIPLADEEGALGLLVVSDGQDDYRFGPRDEEDARLLAAIATDTIRKRLLVESLRRASAAKSEFLASVSHDLRTPLNVILGYTDLLAEETFGPVTAEQLDTLARMRRTAAAQLDLINDLLDLARIEQGKLSCRLRAVHRRRAGRLAARDDGSAAARPADRLRRRHRDRCGGVHRSRAPAPGARQSARERRQVHAARPRAALGAARETTSSRSRVADTGGGMAPAMARQVLEPFVRGADVQAGSGLGLAIVSRLLNVLGGTLQIDSALGRGTTVRVELPAD